MTTKNEISLYFDEGKRVKGNTHMIMVCDTFDHEDYPVYARGNEDCLKKYKEFNGPNMQKVMEVYNLRDPKDAQLNQPRVMRLPR